jgi:hypothetical protein
MTKISTTARATLTSTALPYITAHATAWARVREIIKLNEEDAPVPDGADSEAAWDEFRAAAAIIRRGLMVADSTPEGAALNAYIKSHSEDPDAGAKHTLAILGDLGGDYVTDRVTELLTSKVAGDEGRIAELIDAHRVTADAMDAVQKYDDRVLLRRDPTPEETAIFNRASDAEGAAYRALLACVPATRHELARKVQYVEQRRGSFDAFIDMWEAEDYDAFITSWDVFGYPAPATLEQAMDEWQQAKEVRDADPIHTRRFPFDPWTGREAWNAVNALINFPAATLEDAQVKLAFFAKDPELREAVLDDIIDSNTLTAKFVLSMVRDEDREVILAINPRAAA